MNYFIIGGDGKEYGPITEGNLRQWVAEGRINAQTQTRSDADPNWRALGTVPELSDIFDTPPTISALPSTGDYSTHPTTPNMDYVGRDYDLDIGGCISRGWDLLKNNFGSLFLAFLVFVLTLTVAIVVCSLLLVPFQKALLHSPAFVRVTVNFLIGLMFSAICTPLAAGMFLMFLKTLRGQPTDMGDLFSGFRNNFLQLALGGIVVAAIVNGWALPFRFVWEAKAGDLLVQLNDAGQNPAAVGEITHQLLSALVVCLPVALVCLVPTTFFSVCLQFVSMLIIDKQVGFQTAIKHSFGLVMKHFWQVLGLTLVVGLVIAGGFVACCVGVLVTAPIGIAAMVYAYETIFGERQN